VKVTRLGQATPLLSATSLGGSGGTLDPVVGGGLVPVASGSNSWSWGSNVSQITANGSNALLGPSVNFAAGSNITLSVSSNTLTITSAAGGGSTSYGSNSNAVASANDGGASTLASRADHVHLGVRSLAHSSNSFSGPVILTASGTLGITSPTPGTYNLSAGTGGGGGSALTVKDEGTPLATDATSLDFVGSGVTASGAGATKTITIAGGGSFLDSYLSSSGSARNDEFSAGPSGPAGKWTLVGTTPDDVDENNDYAGILAVRRNDTGSQLTTYHQDLPSFPCDITVKLRAATHSANYARGGGIVLLPTAPTTASSPRYLGAVYDGGRAVSSIVYSGYSGFGSQSSAGLVPAPLGLWLRITVLSGGTTMDTYYSADGTVWTQHQSAVAVGFTVVNAGIGLAPEGQAADLFSLFEFYRVSA